MAVLVALCAYPMRRFAVAFFFFQHVSERAPSNVLAFVAALLPSRASRARSARRPIEPGLDATHWKTVLDFCRALLTGIGAPEWHGMSPDAFVDSMIWGGINAVEPPYIVRISGLAAAPKEVRDEVELVRDVLLDGRIYRKRHNGEDIDVSIVIVSDENEFDDQVVKIRDAVAAVQYEGPDPKIRATIDMLRRKLKLGPLREQ